MAVSDGVKPRFEAVTPRVPVRDVEAALLFYRDRLGFDLGWKWGSPVTHANVCRDSISLDLIASSKQRGSAMAYILVNGVVEYYGEPKLAVSPSVSSAPGLTACGTAR